MGICPECQKEQMVIIGTEKFHIDSVYRKTNWQNTDTQKYMIYTVWYCHKCNVMILREPKSVFG